MTKTDAAVQTLEEINPDVVLEVRKGMNSNYVSVISLLFSFQ